MKANDYLIDQAGFDWQAMLAGWADILPETFTMWLVNRFGDVFIIGEDSSVHHLDIAGGTLHRVADTREQFADLIDVPQNANNWLMIPLVDQCVKLVWCFHRGSAMASRFHLCSGVRTNPGTSRQWIWWRTTPFSLTSGRRRRTYQTDRRSN